MAYVHGPISATLSMNILFFILTAVNICQTGDSAVSTPKTRQKKRKYYNKILSFQIPVISLIIGQSFTVFLHFNAADGRSMVSTRTPG